MQHAKPLPAFLVTRYHGWKATTYSENRTWYRRLAQDGQRPRAMVITCCDSRVNVQSLFEADQGDFFIHRNIANLVPPCEPDGDHHGTSAAVEYAVTVLNVAHLIVLGHSNCGGVQGCLDMCKGHAPELDRKESFVGRWMDILRPKYASVEGEEDPAKQARMLEHAAIVTSLENLMTFPFVADRVQDGAPSLHGLWTDVGEGDMSHLLPPPGQFVAL